jgi:hypothetical protein
VNFTAKMGVAVAAPAHDRSFLLQRVQPAMTGLIDGSLSTLAPIFTVALATHRPTTGSARDLQPRSALG